MEFKLDGLDKPIILPDQYLSVIQYERLQRYLLAHKEEPEDFRFVRQCLAEFLSDPELLARTDDLMMTPHNLEQWEAINNHLAVLLTGSAKVGDDVTNEVVAGPLDENLTETPPPTA
jgi:hypothetical protein